MAAAYPRAGSLWAVMRESLGIVLAPSAGLFWILFMFYQPVLEALYDPTFSAPAPAVALIFAGSLVRIAAWIPLFALYAARRTRAIAIGELLSLPLFAALVLLYAERLTLELIGLLWIGAYAAYAAFNFWMCARR